MRVLWIVFFFSSASAVAGNPCSYGLRDRPVAEKLAPLFAEPFRTSAEAVEKLREGGSALIALGDRRAIFMVTYFFVSSEIEKASSAGLYRDPRWVEEMILSFANLYRVAVWADLSGDCARVPPAWRVAFRSTRSEHAGALLVLLLGIHAHVSRDLAHALLAARTQYHRPAHIHDYQRINRAFQAAMPESWRTIHRFERRHSSKGEARLGRIAFGLLVKMRENAWEWAERASESEDPEREFAKLERHTRHVAKRYRWLTPVLK